MTVALLVVVVGLAGIGATAGAIRRRFANERSSVRDYQQTLETLRHLSDRRAGIEASVRAPAAAPPSPASTGSRAAGRARKAGAGRGANRATAAADAALIDEVARATDASAAGEDQHDVRVDAGSRRTSRARRTTLLASSTPKAGRAPVLADRSGPATVSLPVDAPVVAESAGTTTGTANAHRISAADAVRELAAARKLLDAESPRATMPSRSRGERSPLIWTVAAVAVIGVVTGLVLATGPSHNAGTSGSSAHRTTPTVRPVTAARTSSKRSSASSRASSSGSRGSGGLAPVTASSTTATYQVPSSSYTLTLRASGPCWVEATNNSTGQVLWTGTLHAGDAQSVPASSGVLLRLGDALNVTLVVSGRPVQLPPGSSPTIDLTFLTA